VSVTQALAPRQRRMAGASALLALALASLDQAVGAVLPRAAAELGGLGLYAWVGTAYLMACAVVVPIAGKLGDLLGRRPFLIAGMAGFMVCSGLCGAATTMGELIAARAVQGVFAGTLIATVYTVLADIYPPESRARIQGLASSVFGLSSALGPFVGGVLTDAAGWRWVFYLNLPIGVVALVFATSLPKLATRGSWAQLDVRGVVLLAGGLVPLLIGLSLAGGSGWTGVTWLLIGIGIVVLAGFFAAETWLTDSPLVPFALFRSNPFATAIAIAFLSTFGMMAAVYFVPLLYQGALGVSPAYSGTLLVPLMLGLMVASTLTGRYVTRLPRYRFLAAGAMLLLAVALVLLALTGPDTGVLLPTVATVLVGLSIGVQLPLTTAVVQNTVRRSHLGVGTSQIQFWRVLAGPVSVAVLGAILSARLPGSLSARLAAVHLPVAVRLPAGLTGGNAQSALDPAALDRLRAGLPGADQQLFDALVHALRLGLADSVRPLFLFAAVAAALAAAVSLILREVPLGGPAAPRAADPAREAASEPPGAADGEQPDPSATAD
jgi:EmrB/QacA subfamily drug resistance transporter